MPNLYDYVLITLVGFHIAITAVFYFNIYVNMQSKLIHDSGLILNDLSVHIIPKSIIIVIKFSFTFETTSYILVDVTNLFSSPST